MRCAPAAGRRCRRSGESPSSPVHSSARRTRSTVLLPLASCRAVLDYPGVPRRRRPQGSPRRRAACSRPLFRAASRRSRTMFLPAVGSWSARRLRAASQHAPCRRLSAFQLFGLGWHSNLLLCLAVSCLYGSGEDYDGSAEDYDEVEGVAKACQFGEEPDKGRADEEACVRCGGDGGEGWPCGHTLGAACGAEGCGEDYRETGAGAGEADECDEGLSYGQRGAKSYGGEDPAGADECGRAQALGQTVAEEASEGHRDGERRISCGREARARPQGVIQVDGAPVSHCALPEEDTERDDPKPKESSRRTGERRRPFLGGVGVRGQERPVGTNERYR